tara:strand:- start:177 stop:395 length:219 start_codon:yes stop_codon:yes gene_type:complete
MLGEKMLNALKSSYYANIEKANATLLVYILNPVAIGEHPQHLDEMDTLLDTIATNRDKINEIETIIRENNLS